MVLLEYFAAHAETCPIFADLWDCKGRQGPVLGGMPEMGGHQLWPNNVFRSDFLEHPFQAGIKEP